VQSPRVAPICFATDYSTIGKSVATKPCRFDEQQRERSDHARETPGTQTNRSGLTRLHRHGDFPRNQDRRHRRQLRDIRWRTHLCPASAGDSPRDERNVERRCRDRDRRQRPAYQKAGRKDILIVSADDDPPTLAGIKNGSMAFSFSQQPFGQGYLMVYVPYLMAEKHLHPTVKFFDMGLTMIDKSNVDSYANDVTANWQKIKTQIETTIMVP